MTECRLCGLSTPPSPETDPSVEGAFCCRGCLEVFRTLGDVDIETDATEERTAERSLPDDAGETFLAVDGMHCTTCEAFLDLRAENIDGVYAVEANYATGTARVAYDPDVLDEAHLPEMLSGHGYTARFRQTDDDSADRGGRPRGRRAVERLVVGGFFSMLVMPWYLFYLYPSYVGIETGILDVDTTTPIGMYLPLAIIGLLTSVVLFYTGYPVLRGAWTSVRARHPNMDLLVAIAALSAYGYSTVALATGSTHLYYDVTVAVVMVVTLGRYYEGRIRAHATEMLSSITATRVREATRLTDDGRERVSIESIDPGDRLVVARGERVPLDGTVIEGTAAVDESVLTGDSLPVTKRPGDPVIGGAVVADDAIVIEVGPEGQSTVDWIATALWEIQSSTPGVQRLVDRLATVFVPTVLLLGVSVTVWRFLSGGTVAAALLAGLTVLVVSCPCSMGLATPLAVSAGLRDALEDGVVFANESVFETAPRADTIVFDKTGTLTEGAPRVTDRYGHEETLRLAAAVERLSDHPVSGAVLDAAAGERLAADGGTVSEAAGEDHRPDDGERIKTDDSAGLPDVRAFTRHPGSGVAGTVGDRRIVVGTSELVRERAGPVPEHLSERIERIDDRGGLPVVVGWGESAKGVLAIFDRTRADWEAALDMFSELSVAVLTGDAGASADQFEAHPAVDTVFRGVPPDGKVETVRRLAADGTVVMVGDGTNDAPALAAADLGIALGSGTARAIDAADAVVTDDKLSTIGTVFEAADGTNRRIQENVAWAFCYNAIAIPLAAAGVINPLFAAVAMAASSLLVVTNSRRSVV